MLIDVQRILHFHGDTLEDAVGTLHAAIEALPLDARIASISTTVDDGRVAGIAVVELIPEASAEPGPTRDEGDDPIVTDLPLTSPLADSI